MIGMILLALVSAAGAQDIDWTMHFVAEVQMGEPVDTPLLQFNTEADSGVYEVGRLFVKDGKIDFEGDATEAAQRFIEELRKSWRRNGCYVGQR